MESGKRFNRRGASLVALTTAAAIFLAGCATDSGNGNGGQPEPAADVDPRSPEISDLVVAGYPQGPFAPVSVAMSEGIAEEYGISVELQPAENAPAMLAQIISGDVPIGAVNGFFSVPAVREGAELLVIGEVIRGIPDGQTVEVLPDSGIESPADLEGKKVGVVGLNSGHQARIEKAVILDGGDPSKVEFVSLGWAEMAPALEQGTADAVAVTGAFQFATRDELGSQTIIDLGDGPFAEFPDAQWLVNKAWAEANPNTIAAFQCAVVVKGAEAVNEDRELYEQALRDFGYSEEAIAADQKLIHPAANDPVQIIPDLMYELGWIDEEFDMSSITLPLPDNC